MQQLGPHRSKQPGGVVYEVACIEKMQLQGDSQQTCSTPGVVYDMKECVKNVLRASKRLIMIEFDPSIPFVQHFGMYQIAAPPPHQTSRLPSHLNNLQKL
jgi:hypothetical protein